MEPLNAGQPAPAFQLEDIYGQEIRLEDFRGQPVLLTFWSAECPWVERIDRELENLRDVLPQVMIASNANEPPDLLRSVAEARGLKVVLIDSEQEVSDRYGVQITPHCFLLDSSGIVRYQGAFDDVGFRQRAPTRSYVREALAALLDGKPPAVPETPPFGCTVVRKEALA